MPTCAATFSTGPGGASEPRRTVERSRHPRRGKRGAGGFGEYGTASLGRNVRTFVRHPRAARRDPTPAGPRGAPHHGGRGGVDHRGRRLSGARAVVRVAVERPLVSRGPRSGAPAGGPARGNGPCRDGRRV